MKKHIQLTLHPHLFSELPKFFGGPRVILKELFQNSHRAGATEIRVQHTPTRVVVCDNGRGLPDPEVLLQAAGSQWDEQVIDPAGLGAFSTLNPEYVEKVTFASCGWSVTVTPQHLTTLERLEVQPGTVHTGMQVTLDLKKPLFEAVATSAVQTVYREIRAFIPVLLFVNDTPIEPVSFEGMHVLHTEDALVYCSEKHTLRSHPSGLWIVWEGQPFKITPWQLNGFEDLCGKTYCQNGQVFVLPNRNAKIRPKLPDRSAFIEDDHLKLFVQRVLQGLSRHLLDLYRPFVQTLPDLLRDPQQVAWPPELKPHGNPFWHAALTHLGYQVCPVVSYQYTGDERQFMEVFDEHLLSKEAVKLAREEACLVWNTLHIAGHPGFEVPATQDPHGAEVHIVPRTYRDKSFMQVSHSITVAGKALPYYVDQQVHLHREHGEVLFHLAGSGHEALWQMATCGILQHDHDRRNHFVDDVNYFDDVAYRLDLQGRIASTLGLSAKLQGVKQEQNRKNFQEARQACLDALAALQALKLTPESERDVRDALQLVEALQSA